jgi:hypothetical protein
MGSGADGLGEGSAESSMVVVGDEDSDDRSAGSGGEGA